MAYKKLLTADEIVNAAVRAVEQGNADGLSLRALANALGVKAPSLYRYFPDKSALELAIAIETLRRMQAELEPGAALPDPRVRVIEMAETYVRFAREHYALYSWIFQGRVQSSYGSSEGKALWHVMLEAVSGVTGTPDDTASTVALWAFLHGYATLEQAGSFGASGPKGAFAVGLKSFLASTESLSQAGQGAQKEESSGAQRKKPVKHSSHNKRKQG